MPLHKITVAFTLDTPDVDTTEEYVRALIEDIKETEAEKPILTDYKFIVVRELVKCEL